MGCEERARLPRNHTQTRCWQMQDSRLFRACLRAASHRAALAIKAETVANVELCLAVHGAPSIATCRHHHDYWQCRCSTYRDGRCRSLEVQAMKTFWLSFC